LNYALSCKYCLYTIITYNIEETFVFNLFKKLKSHMYFRLKKKEREKKSRKIRANASSNNGHEFELK